ncbi:CCR4-NOT regulatory complex component [Saitoella coloradoensis]
MGDATQDTSVELQKLSFSYTAENSSHAILDDVSLSLPPGSRTLLIGANGAGKTTILRILAGKRIAKDGAVKIGGVDPFRDGAQGITYLGTEWANNPIVRNDIPVAHLIASVGGEAYPERRDELVRILDVDLSWRMHAVSDGQRRRVQLVMGLMRPWRILLLDEVTVDLDVLVRADFLDFLERETKERGCTIVYATHIFDGLSSWPTHLVHISLGRISSFGPASEYPELNTTQSTGNSSLLALCLGWLKEDREKIRAGDKRIKWEDISELQKHGEGGAHKFGKYFNKTRGKE